MPNLMILEALLLSDNSKIRRGVSDSLPFSWWCQKTKCTSWEIATRICWIKETGFEV